ncbi:hypothetical protein ACQQ2N_18335 [Dokdonella sp. MW10]|uniref:hypothetical protein n=1 Tax=Dokdonella sp. MW10 TaxID=2992926 RepID=UPI003F822291
MSSSTPRSIAAQAFALAALLSCAGVAAHTHSEPVESREAPRALAVKKELGAPPKDVVELKFRDLFAMPVGPRGLEPSDTLKAAAGKRVRMVGFMVQQSPATLGGFLLSPLPVAAGDADEDLADDLPPGLVRVELPAHPDRVLPHLRGLIHVTGTLELGAQESREGTRISFVRIVPDRKTERALAKLAHAP